MLLVDGVVVVGVGRNNNNINITTTIVIVVVGIHISIRIRIRTSACCRGSTGVYGPQPIPGLLKHYSSTLLTGIATLTLTRQAESRRARFDESSAVLLGKASTAAAATGHHHVVIDIDIDIIIIQQ